jgi:hypothetical protein
VPAQLHRPRVYLQRGAHVLGRSAHLHASQLRVQEASEVPDSIGASGLEHEPRFEVGADGHLRPAVPGAAR